MGTVFNILRGNDPLLKIAFCGLRLPWIVFEKRGKSEEAIQHTYEEIVWNAVIHHSFSFSSSKNGALKAQNSRFYNDFIVPEFIITPRKKHDRNCLRSTLRRGKLTFHLLMNYTRSENFRPSGNKTRPLCYY